MPKRDKDFSDTFCPYNLFDGIFIPNVLVSYGGIRAIDKICLARLFRYCGKNEYCWPRQETIAEELGISVRAVNECIRKLERSGFIRVKQKGMGYPNEYYMREHPITHPDKFKAMVAVVDTQIFAGLQPQIFADPLHLFNEEYQKEKRVISKSTTRIKNKKNSDKESNMNTSNTWTDTDIRTFNQRFKSIPRSKLNNGQSKFLIKFFETEGITLDQAIQAADNYKDYCESNSVPEVNSRVFEKHFFTILDFKSPELPVDDFPTRPVRGTSKLSDALQLAETTQKSILTPEAAVEIWNQRVPSSPIKDWRPDKDDHPKLKKMCLDPDFADNIISICDKAEAIHKSGGDWAPTFRWLLKKKGNVDNWWTLHTGELDGMTKKRKKSAKQESDEQGDRVLKKMLAEMQGNTCNGD